MAICLHSNLDPSKNIDIIGGGISALALGYFFSKQNIPFTIHEKESRVGGKIHTLETQYGRVEKAANAFYTSQLIKEVFKDLEIQAIPAQKKLARKVWRKTKIYSPPLRFFEIILVLIKSLKKIPFQNFDNLSVHDFFSPWLGEKICSEVLAAALVGVYSHDIKELHFKSLFKEVNLDGRYFHFLISVIKKRKQNPNAQSVSFQLGMQEFINRLSDKLKNHIKTNAKINNLPSDNFIIATDANQASDLMRSFDSDCASYLSKIQYSYINTKTMFTKTEINQLKNSFGVLFGPKSDFASLGILANHCIFPHSVASSKTYSYTFITKGNSVSRIEEDLIKLGEQESYKERYELTETEWRRAIPIYNLERFLVIKQLKKHLSQSKQSFGLFGNYIDGVSLREIFSLAKEFSEEIKKL